MKGLRAKEVRYEHSSGLMHRVWMLTFIRRIGRCEPPYASAPQMRIVEAGLTMEERNNRDEQHKSAEHCAERREGQGCGEWTSRVGCGGEDARG